MAKDYTARILEARSKQTSFDDLDYTPLSVPAGAVLPETSQQTMARMMLSSGMISLDDYQKMIGVVFDGDYDNERETFGDFGQDERDFFEQSSLAQYEDDFYNDSSSERMEAPQTSVTEIPVSSSGSDTGDSGTSAQKVDNGQGQTESDKQPQA